MFRSTRKTLFFYFLFFYFHCMYIYIQTTCESLFPHSRLDGPADHNFQLPDRPLVAWFTESMPINTSTYTALDMNTYSCSHLVRALAHVPFVFEHNVTTTVTITFVVIPGATIPTRACHVISSPKQTVSPTNILPSRHTTVYTQHAYLPDDHESGVAVRSRILRPSLTVTLRPLLHRYRTYPTLQVHMASGLAPRNPP